MVCKALFIKLFGNSHKVNTTQQTLEPYYKDYEYLDQYQHLRFSRYPIGEPPPPQIVDYGRALHLLRQRGFCTQHISDDIKDYNLCKIARVELNVLQDFVPKEYRRLIRSKCLFLLINTL